MKPLNINSKFVSDDNDLSHKSYLNLTKSPLISKKLNFPDFSPMNN